MLVRIKQALSSPLNSFLFFVFVVIAAVGVFFAVENELIVALLVVPLVLISVLVDYRNLYYLLVFFLPLSTTLRIDSINLSIGFPSEPLIGLLAIISVIFVFLNDRKSGILSHPLTMILLVYWAIQVMSLICSTMPMVSVKTLVVITSYMLVFYVLFNYFLLYNSYNVKSIYFLYALSLFGIVCYVTWLHAGYAFNKSMSAVIVKPFFSDHTIYGACLAFMIPVAGIFYFKSAILKLNSFQKLLSLLFLIAFLTGVYLSHSRATWMSLVSIGVMLLILRFRISFKTLMAILAIGLVIVLFNKEEFMPALVKNKYDSKAKRANLEEQIKSVTNIKNDVSNAERVNRWMCAIRMFKEKPLTGFGIGTYQFKYIPFQKGSEMTTISVTSAKNNYSQGVGGTAHSEYLLTLSESGLFSGIALVILVFYSVYLGMKLYYTTEGETKYYALMVLLGLLTYFLHGVFNNFLTTDKAAFLVWGGLAVLCAMDLKTRKINRSNSTIQ